MLATAMCPIPPHPSRKVGENASRIEPRQVRIKVIGSISVFSPQNRPCDLKLGLFFHSILRTFGKRGAGRPANIDSRHIAKEARKSATRIPPKSSGYSTRFFRARSRSEHAPTEFP